MNCILDLAEKSGKAHAVLVVLVATPLITLFYSNHTKKAAGMIWVIHVAKLEGHESREQQKQTIVSLERSPLMNL